MFTAFALCFGGSIAPVHDLSEELRSLPPDASEAARLQALRLEGRDVFSIRSELLVALYAAVATLVAGVGLLVKANLDRIVSCVNACKGIDPHNVPDLRKALQRMLSDLDSQVAEESFPVTFRMARKALGTA